MIRLSYPRVKCSHWHEVFLATPKKVAMNLMENHITHLELSSTMAFLLFGLFVASLSIAVELSRMSGSSAILSNFMDGALLEVQEHLAELYYQNHKIERVKEKKERAINYRQMKTHQSKLIPKSITNIQNATFTTSIHFLDLCRFATTSERRSTRFSITCITY